MHGVAGYHHEFVLRESEATNLGNVFQSSRRLCVGKDYRNYAKHVQPIHTCFTLRCRRIAVPQWAHRWHRRSAALAVVHIGPPAQRHSPLSNLAHPLSRRFLLLFVLLTLFLQWPAADLSSSFILLVSLLSARILGLCRRDVLCYVASRV